MALFALAVLHSAPGAYAAPEVVVSIKPIHALVAGVMGGTGTPWLIVEGGASPHTYQMRPSEAEALQTADLVVWVDETLEAFLERPIASLGAGAEIVTLHRVAGMRLLRNREGGIWDSSSTRLHDGENADTHDPDTHDSEAHDSEAHDSDTHDPDTHDSDTHDSDTHDSEDHDSEDHDSEDHDSEDHDSEDHDSEDHGHDHDHAHGELDAHIWLDPRNAARIVEVVAAALIRIHPEAAAVYRRNAAAMQARIAALEASLREQLAPVRRHAFVVFHDGYQYFEHAFGLNGIGAVTLDSTRLPSAKRLTSLRRALVERDVQCLFTEPQFEPRLALTVIEGTEVRTAVIDLLGADVAAGADAWFDVMRRLGDSVAGCLGGA